MNYSFYLSAFLVGFLGSFHCVGMCGPIAISLPRGNGSKMRILSGKVFYNIGRIVTYSILGLFVGIIGYSFSIKGFQRELSIISGFSIILIVLFTNGNFLSSYLTQLFGKYTFFLKQRFKKLFSKGSSSFLFSIGLLNGLLPCGFVYLALAGALTTGNYTSGILYMVMFGLGTFPAMLTMSIAGHLIGTGFKKHIQRATPVIAITLAILLIYRGSGEKVKCCEHPAKENSIR